MWRNKILEKATYKRYISNCNPYKHYYTSYLAQKSRTFFRQSCDFRTQRFQTIEGPISIARMRGLTTAFNDTIWAVPAAKAPGGSWLHLGVETSIGPVKVLRLGQVS